MLGTTWVITGASGGLGRALARKSWAEGASLFLVDCRQGLLEALAASLPPPGHEQQRIVLFPCDLGCAEQLSAVSGEVARGFDTPTILVNNAAVLGPIGPIWENDMPQWELAIRVNLLAPAALCRAAIPAMRARGYGKIINISGGGATAPRPNFSAYATTKAGLVRLTEVLAHETRGTGIDVNCIAPGAMNTQLLDQVLEAGPSRAGATEFERAQRQAAEGGMSPDRAADLVVFLASHASDGITGRLISAVWDPWPTLAERRAELQDSDIYTLRRITPEDRGRKWD